MPNWINNKILINCLAANKNNAKQIYDISNNSILIGVLSKNYISQEKAIFDIQEYKKITKNHISIGLGAGDPSMWKRVANISKVIQPYHINQIFTATGYTRALINNEKIIINSLISPSGKVGFVKVSTGEFSSKFKEALIPTETAIIMLKEQGANSIKFFNMKGLTHIEEFKEVAKYCGIHNVILEPTGGINLKNFDEIVTSALNCGAKKIIIHVYSSIIDKNTNETKLEDIKKLQKKAKDLSM